MAADEPDHRHLGLRVRPEERARNRDGRAPPSVSRRISSCSSAARPCTGRGEKAPRRRVALAARQLGRLCSSRWTRRPRLNRSRPPIAQRRHGRRLARRSAATGTAAAADRARPAAARSPSRAALPRARACPRPASRRGGAVCGAVQPQALRPTSRRRRSASPRRNRRASALAARARARHSVCHRSPAPASRGSASRRCRAGPAPGSARHRAGGDIPAAGAASTPAVRRAVARGDADRRAASTAAVRLVSVHSSGSCLRPAPASCRAGRRSALRAPWRRARSGCAPRRAGARRNRA